MARVVQEDGSWLLHYMYTNEPDVALLKRSPIHHGSGVLTVIGNPAKRLSGTYWTDRDSKGKLTLDRRTRKLGKDFRDCTELFAGRGILAMLKEARLLQRKAVASLLLAIDHFNRHGHWPRRIEYRLCLTSGWLLS